MSTEAFILFVVGALFLAALLILSGMRTHRSERQDLETARAREEAARNEAERAKLNRLQWEAKLAAETEQQRHSIVAAGDPRGLSDGLGRGESGFPASKRFARDVPAPFTA